MNFKKENLTLKNLEAAFGGESMAYMKYTYFAKICRAHGDIQTAEHFEATAKQELLHAIAHLELLLPADKLNPVETLKLAIEGELYESQHMYKDFYEQAVKDGSSVAQKEFSEQIAESGEHAAQFAKVLETAAKRFNSLRAVEARHAAKYQARLDSVSKGD